MAYDRDGSVGFLVPHPGNSGTPTSLTSAELADLNKEAEDGYTNTSWNTMGLGVIFPELRDIDGAAILHASGTNDWSVVDIATSTDTTNGVDGTWTVRGTGNTWKADPANPGWRDEIDSVTWTGVKAVRYRCSSGGSATRKANIHLYGSPASGTAPDRLQFWLPSTDSDAQVGGAYFDWGDVSRGTSDTRSFRVHNPSASLTAFSVTVSIEALTDTSPSNVGQHELSTDSGSSWASTASLGDMSAGTTSDDIILRRSIGGSAALSIWAVRLVASASSWS